MGNRFPQTTPKKLLKALQKVGVVVKRQKGSHISLQKGKELSTIALHCKEFSRPMVQAILKQLDIPPDKIRPYL